ncbi:MAG TPA: hypothetical protein VMP08_26135 [Anaerolineae bacterium]|nr:hypothetical protein [Anaerolineae bacterium]
MNRLTMVILPVLTMTIVACASPNSVTLTIAEDTWAGSARGKAAIIWLADGERHFGILDSEKASVSELSFSLEDSNKQSGDIVWSPTGTAFIYEQYNVYPVDGTLFNYDIFGVWADSRNSGEVLDKNIHTFTGCTWSPDGHYVACTFNSNHAECGVVYDSSTWKPACAFGGLFSCNTNQFKYCQPLLLDDGYFWDTSELRSIERPTSVPTGAIHSDITYILPGAKILNVTWGPSK